MSGPVYWSGTTKINPQLSPQDAKHARENTMSLNTKFDELLEFPCQFPFKVLGVAHPELADQVVALLQQHAPGDYSPTLRPSAKGNYVSVSVTVTATSKDHLETMYVELGKLELVRMVL
jgi:uncharacterized protein